MAKQVIIEKIQTWLNQTYQNSAGYNTIAVTGTPGWDTTNAMLIAYQIEDGVSTGIINNETSSGIYDFAGENFTPISSGTDFSTQSNKNKLMILQGAFYVMGINPGSFGGAYSSSFESAVSTLQSNAGVAATGIADLLVVKALLSMDSFTVLSQYGGVEAIAQIQRALNAEYAQDMGGLIPCDGVYGRDLNKALIYALQIQEGISVADANEADGYFGHGTQADCPTLVPNDTNEFVTILQYALYCNGYTGVSFTGTYDAATQIAVATFGSAMHISTENGSEVNLEVWMGLLLSSGDPNKSVSGCDAAQTLTLEDAQILKANGYDIVGRYLTGDFQTSIEELTDIIKGGLSIFPIYETDSNEIDYFSAEQGIDDAISAVQAATELGIPFGTRIYFTVDYDMEATQITDLVIPYFRAIYDKFENAQLKYNIGIYGSRNVCQQVIEAGYAEFAFVDGASTGYSGNMGYPMPDMWAFNQIKEGVNIGGVQVDNDQVSGREAGFNSISPQGNIIESLRSNSTTNVSKMSATNKARALEFSKNILDALSIGNNINIKIDTLETDLMKLISESNDTLIPLGPNHYLKINIGVKTQIGSGKNTCYIGEDGTSLEVWFNNLGGKFTNIILKDGVGGLQNAYDDLQFTSTCPGGGYVQMYPVSGYGGDYVESTVELGYTFTTGDLLEYIDCPKNVTSQNDLEKWINDNIGLYFYVDLILGTKIPDDKVPATAAREIVFEGDFIIAIYTIMAQATAQLKGVMGFLGNMVPNNSANENVGLQLDTGITELKGIGIPLGFEF